MSHVLRVGYPLRPVSGSARGRVRLPISFGGQKTQATRRVKCGDDRPKNSKLLNQTRIIRRDLPVSAQNCSSPKRAKFLPPLRKKWPSVATQVERVIDQRHRPSTTTNWRAVPTTNQARKVIFEQILPPGNDAPKPRQTLGASLMQGQTRFVASLRSKRLSRDLAKRSRSKESSESLRPGPADAQARGAERFLRGQRAAPGSHPPGRYGLVQ